MTVRTTVVLPLRSTRRTTPPTARRRPQAALAPHLCVVLLSATHATAFAHGGAWDALAHGGLERAPIWLTQVVFVLAWLAYLGGGRRQPARRGPRRAFHTAMLITGLALFGPLDDWAERSVAWHMVQHMLLIGVVAPLAALARPLRQWRAVLGPTADAVWRPLQRLSRRPMACALLHAAAIWFWHLPGPYVAAVQTPLWHVLEHASFLLSGWLFWWAVLHPGRTGTLPAAMALLFTVMHTGLLGALLSFAPVALYGTQADALAQQQLAGLLMWVPGGLVYLAVAVWAAVAGVAGRGVRGPRTRHDSGTRAVIRRTAGAKGARRPFGRPQSAASRSLSAVLSTFPYGLFGSSSIRR